MHSDPIIARVMDTWMPRFLGGGIAYYDILTALERIQTWDDWGPVWMEMAEMHEALAEEAWDQGRRITAVQGFQTASAYYHIAYFVYMRDMDLHNKGLQKMVACHERVLPYMEPAVEKIKIPFEDSHILGLFSKPKGEGPFPVLIVLPGLDSTKETRHRARGTYLRRGLAVLSLEGPGQGEVSQWFKIRPDYEVAATAAIDYLETREDVDASRIGMFGMSMGGYYAPRSAAFEPRIKAVAGSCGAHTYSECFVVDTRPPVSREAFMHYSGTKSEEEAFEFSKRMSLEGIAEKITCPLLVIHGKLDPLVPWEQGKRIVDQASSEDKQFVLYEEGIHSCSNVRYKAGPLVTNWLTEKLGGTLV
jgi:2,6-dihydroxypseudooxynicotine hydrolase